MTHFARKTAGVVRENLVAFRDLSLNTFYLPPGAPLTFQPMRQVERLHIVLEGACTIRPGRNVFKVEKGAAVGIAAPGAHKIEASEQGVALMTAAFRHDDRDAGSGNDGIAIFDLLGLPQGEVAAQLDHWAGRTGVRGRAFFMVHRDTGEGVRVHRRAHRVFVVLRGAISVETPAGATRVQAMEVFPVPPATPHRVVMGAGVTGRVLVFTDSEGAEEVLNHVSCGAAFERCFLADFRGEGQVVLTGDGTVVSANRAAVAWLGLPESPVGARLFDFLPSTDAARLSRHLKQPVGRPPARWRLHLETSPASRVEAVFVPYQGRRRVQKAVLVLRRFQDDGLEHPGGPVRLPRPEQDLEAFLAVSPSMVELSRELRPLALSNRWVVVGGEPGTGRTTVASLLHHMGEHPDGRFVIRDCAAWTPAQVLDAVARPSSGPGGGWVPGYWLEQGTTVLLDHLDQLPAGARQEILRRLNRLQDGREVRVALESARLVPRGLPSARPGKPFPTRGRFVVVPLPPLRERRADIPGLLNRFFQRHAGGHPLPILSSEALAFLMHYEFPNNLHDLDRIARALAEIPVEGAVSEGTIRALLGEAETPVGRVEGDLPTLAQAECNLLRAALDQARGNKSEAARRLGIPRARLARLIVKHGLGG